MKDTLSQLRGGCTSSVTGFTVHDFRAYQKKTLRAFVSFELPRGMIIHGCTLHDKNGSRWIGLPAKEFTKTDGTRSWVPQIEFASKEGRDKFQSAALAAIDAFLADERL